ncbi:MAG: type II toxin-antitoxin system PemK/MazF family toxin, partial [Gammaproteobacteria bacterium]
KGLTVAITGHDTTGVAVCNQVRSFDIEERVRKGTARYVETLDTATISEIINRVISIIEPA